MNGTWKDTSCQTCSASTSYKKSNKANGTAIAGYECMVCNGNGGSRYLPAGTAISGAPCKECKGNSAYAGNKANGSNASNGQCCVNGTMQASATYCPKDCTVGGVTYKSGATIGNCGKCNNGAAQMNGTWKDTTCQSCSSSTNYMISKKIRVPINACSGCGANATVEYAPAGTAISGQPCKECNGSGGERNRADRTDAGNGKCCFSGQATGTWYWANNQWSCCPSGQTDVGCGCGVAKVGKKCCSAGEIEACTAPACGSTKCCPAGHHYQYYSWSKGVTHTVCCKNANHWPALNAATCCPQPNLYYSNTSGTGRCCTKAVYDATNGTCYGGGLSSIPCPAC